LEHNPDTEKDLPLDPDATEVVAVDMEAMLHAELDAERASKRRLPIPRPAAGRPPSLATVRAMRAAPRVSTHRISAGRVSIPRMPIHTIPPPRSSHSGDTYEEDPTTHVYDRASVRSCEFRAADFTPPPSVRPFNTVPAIPAAKRASADDSQQTAYQPVLAPTSRRDLSARLSASAFESIAPMAMSAFPSVPPPAKANTSSMVAILLTMIFTLATVAVMGLGVFKPTALDRARIVVAGAMKGNQKRHAPPPPVAVEAPPPASIAVPPVLIDDVPSDLGEKETAIYLSDSAKGHRVFIDGRVQAETVRPYLVTACGKHKVQIGSTAKEQMVDLPCGGISRPE
jgi:hypothetical protein